MVQRAPFHNLVGITVELPSRGLAKATLPNHMDVQDRDRMLDASAVFAVATAAALAAVTDCLETAGTSAEPVILRSSTTHLGQVDCEAAATADAQVACQPISADLEGNSEAVIELKVDVHDTKNNLVAVVSLDLQLKAA